MFDSFAARVCCEEVGVTPLSVVYLENRERFASASPARPIS